MVVVDTIKILNLNLNLSFTHHGKPWLKPITFIFQELQAELEVQQEHVNNLQNMVVVVDEVAGDTSEYMCITGDWTRRKLWYPAVIITT